MTVGDLLTWATKVLRDTSSHTARLDTLVLLEHVLKRDRTWLLAHGGQSLSQIQTRKARRIIKQRINKVPVAYLTGAKEFYGFKFKINDRVLTPRPESEPMVDFAIEHTPANSPLLDIGTGSGCLAIAIAKKRPDLQITASDISKAALKLAKDNAHTHRVSVRFVHSNLFEQLAKQRFATIVANLPYVRDDLVLDKATQHEPKLAIRGGQDGLKYYRPFFAEAKDHLSSDGVVIIESLPDQHPLLIRLARTHGFKLLDQQQLILAFKVV